jgi:hypothetical protein
MFFPNYLEINTTDGNNTVMGINRGVNDAIRIGKKTFATNFKISG